MMRRLSWFWVAIALVQLGSPRDARATGLTTPGQGGYAGVTGPMTILYNPAGLTLTEPTVFYVNTFFILNKNLITYEPAASTSGAPLATEHGAGPWFSLPSFGISTRFASRDGRRPLPLAVGLVFQNTYGGIVQFDEKIVRPGRTSTTMLAMEIVPAIAYQIHPTLSIGLGLRVGFGILDLSSNERAEERVPYTFSGSAVQVGATIGGTWQPLAWFRLGMSYGSPLPLEFRGKGRLETRPGVWREDNFTLTQPFPQWAALGLSFGLTPLVRLNAGLRWTDWSAFTENQLRLASVPDSIERLDFSDGVTAHLGVEVAVPPARWTLRRPIGLRASVSYDSNTVPDHAMERYQFDMDKVSVALGLTIGVSRSWFVNLGPDLLFGLKRTVPDIVRVETDQITGITKQVRTNPAPGRYAFNLFAFNLGVHYVY